MEISGIRIKFKLSEKDDLYYLTRQINVNVTPQN